MHAVQSNCWYVQFLLSFDYWSLHALAAARCPAGTNKATITITTDLACLEEQEALLNLCGSQVDAWDVQQPSVTSPWEG